MNRIFRCLLLALIAVLAAGCCRNGDRDPGVDRLSPRRVIASEGAPAAIGPYSQAVQVGDVLYLAGQIALDPGTGEMVAGGIEAETRQVLANLEAVLDGAGFTFADVVQSQVFLADLEDYGAMNAVYAERFPVDPPARAAVQVARLPRDARVEIMMVAVRSR